MTKQRNADNANTSNHIRSGRSTLHRAIALSVATTLVASGCATAPGTPGGYLKETFASDDPCANNARNMGLAAGVIAGALLGAVLANDKKVGALVGAGLGAAVGGLIGADVDRRRCELSRIAKKHDLDMTIVALDAVAGANSSGAQGGSSQSAGLLVSITDNEQAGKGQFSQGSAVLLPAARAYFLEIAQQYSYAAQAARLGAKSSEQERNSIEVLKSKRILLVGHTDDIGSSSYNADLSERRARAVAAVFREAGVPDSQLFYQGAGETLPIADNHDEAGRAKNRRVEIVDLTDDASFARFLEVRRPNVAFYRNNTEVPSAEVPAQAGQSHVLRSRANQSRKSMAALSKPKVDVGPQAKTGGTASEAPTIGTAQVSASVPGTSGQPANQAVVRKTDVRAAPAAAAQPWDFGGAPTNATPASFDLGKLERSSGFSLISPAVADTPVARCDLDRPRAAKAVKSLKDDKAIATGDYMPGLYNTSWTDNVNGNLVALTGVAVLRDGGSPAHRPTLLIYRDYQSSKQVADLRATPEVNTYRGDKALLYRVFVNQTSVRCLDIVIPHTSPDRAQGSWLRYDRAGEQYSAAFNPQLVRLK